MKIQYFNRLNSNIYRIDNKYFGFFRRERAVSPTIALSMARVGADAHIRPQTFRRE